MSLRRSNHSPAMYDALEQLRRQGHFNRCGGVERAAASWARKLRGEERAAYFFLACLDYLQIRAVSVTIGNDWYTVHLAETPEDIRTGTAQALVREMAALQRRHSQALENVAEYELRMVQIDAELGSIAT